MQFDKYRYYHDAVQAPDVDARFIHNLYRRLHGRSARILREDFCGTFAVLCEWVKISKHHKGIGIDLDPEPLQYGALNYLPRLKPEQQQRLHLLEDDVLKVRPPTADVVVAMNFSYCLFHERELLLRYFKRVYAGLKSDGIFIVDNFGGSACQGPITDKTRKRDYWYFWQQENFEPVTHKAKFHIHFKRDGEKLRRRVFSYDWRLWTIPELRELMKNAGFHKTLVYWQDDKGHFRASTKGEPCEAWISYVVGLK